MTSILKLTANCQLEAAGTKDQPRRFTASPAYSGGTIPGFTLEPPVHSEYVLDLASMQTHDGKVIANLDHKPDARVGHVDSITNDGKQLSLAGIVSAATLAATEFLESADRNFPWAASIEGAVPRPRLERNVTVNGRHFDEVLVSRNWKLTGVAFVSHGADSSTKALAASYSHRGRTKMSDTLPTTDERAVVLVRCENVKLKCDRFRSRLNEIRENALAAETFNPVEFEREIAELELRDSQVAELRARSIQPGQISNTHPGGSTLQPSVMAAALCLQANLPNPEKHFRPEILEAATAPAMRGFSLHQALMSSAVSNGYSARPGEHITQGNLRTVLEHAFAPSTARLSGFSTTTLPNILGEVANKQLLAGYLEEDASWREIAEVKSVSNFHTQNHYRLLDDLAFAEVGEAGEIQHGTLADEGYTSKAKTFGRMLGLTRQQIINDDLGAFSDIRTRLGRGSAKAFNDVFWKAFMDNAAFFTTARTNFIEGATTNLGLDGVGLGLGLQAFRKMTSPAADGKKRVGAGLNPTKIVVPPELELIAMTLFANTNLGTVESGKANIFANRFRPVVQWRLSSAAFTGNSETSWYMFGDEVKPMLVTFLNGNQTPIIESTDADFNTLGIQFRGYFDFGAGKSEYLAGVKSKGAV